MTSVIACENTQPGDPPSDWQVSGQGDTTIQGFGTSMSVNAGQTISFKINTPSTKYHIDILRIGYYQGNGARIVAKGLLPTATLPQSQPACKSDTAATGLLDCGNWAVSASWTVPATAVSGLYIAHLKRDDTTTGNGSLIPFVVRNDTSHSDILFQTDDETWEAYNTYPSTTTGNSLYQCTDNCPPGSPEAYKGAAAVSYNRPWQSAVDDIQPGNTLGSSYFLYAEYNMIRFLEQNGYDVSYTSGVDMSQPGAASLIEQHKIFLTAGHDEYWSGQQRANVTAARDAGVNMAFFTANEVFWKTRFASEHRRVEHPEPDPGDVQGDSLRRSRRSAGPAHLDGRVDGPAVQPASGRRAAAERADRSAVRCQLRHDRYHRAVVSTRSCDSGATPAWPA